MVASCRDVLVLSQPTHETTRPPSRLHEPNITSKRPPPSVSRPAREVGCLPDGRLRPSQRSNREPRKGGLKLTREARSEKVSE
jgi:hypothetical protein